MTWNAIGWITVALFLKMWFVTLVQGYIRLTTKQFVLPEDAEFFGDGNAHPKEHPTVERATRTLRNDLENIPMFLFLLWSYAQLQCWSLGVWIYGGVFVLSRCIHTFAYLKPRQPLRNRAYIVGVLVCLILSGHILFNSFSG